MWMRMLVNQVIRQAAEDKVKGFLMDTVQGQVGAADGGELTPEDLKCDVLLVFGSRSEAGGWVDQAEQVQSWPMDVGSGSSVVCSRSTRKSRSRTTDILPCCTTWPTCAGNRSSRR